MDTDRTDDGGVVERGRGREGRGDMSGTASDSMQSAGALCVLGAAGAAAFLWYAATADGWMGNARRRALTAVRLRQQAGVIDGKAIAAEVRGEVAARILALNEKYPKKQFQPGLAVVIVGDRKDSQTYVRMKRRACEEVGIQSFHHEVDASIGQEELVAMVRKLNADRNVHGILVQLPLPAHISETAVLGAISIEKDVDGFHPMNIGELAMKGRDPQFAPCTPVGCIELLKREGVPLNGANCVVVGRSNIVGMPAALLLIKENATVTIVHSRTTDGDMRSILRRADVIIAAAGMPGMISADMLKRGCVVIDVGTNAVDDPTKKAGYRLVGDVQYAAARYVASKITPVPGGVGPMTIAMLLRNTLKSAERAYFGEAGEDSQDCN